MYVCMYIYVCIYIYTHTKINVYVNIKRKESERERKRERGAALEVLFVYRRARSVMFCLFCQYVSKHVSRGPWRAVSCLCPFSQCKPEPVQVCFSPNRYGLGFSPQKKGGPRWLDGWAAATGLGFGWAPFMFPFWVLGRMGGPRQRSWASIGLPSYFLSGRLGRMGKPWAPVGLPSCFLLSASWVGWVGRGQEAGLPSYCLSGLLGRMGGPRPRSWARVGLPSCFLLSGSWVGWVPLGFLHAGSRWAPFMFPERILSGSWVGWVARGKEAGLPLGSLQRPKSLAPVGLPSFSLFLGSWVGWVGRGQELGSLHIAFLGSWPRPRSCVGLPSCFLLLGPGSDGCHWAPFIFPCNLFGLFAGVISVRFRGLVGVLQLLARMIRPGVPVS